jgi:hypothetical protein
MYTCVAFSFVILIESTNAVVDPLPVKPSLAITPSTATMCINSTDVVLGGAVEKVTVLPLVV